MPFRSAYGGGAAASAESRVFVDRMSESAALTRSIEAHHRRVANDEISPTVFHHVLTYYGTGGMGKSALSTRLSRWISDPSFEVPGWITRPTVPVGGVGRWELNDSKGGVDCYDLLLVLRRAFGEVQKEWPAFDLAFAALAQGLGRSQDVSLCRTPDGESHWNLSEVVAGAVDDVATLADVVGGGLAGTGISLISKVVSRQRQTQRTKRLFDDWADYGLEDLVRACIGASGAEDETLDLAIRVARLLTLEVFQMAPQKRPLVLVFVDHFERLQGAERAGERTLHGLVTALPYVLFVITGRNPVGWGEMGGTGLRPVGPRAWPGLVLSEPPPEDPRQHLLGHLEQEDATQMLTTRFAEIGATVSAETVESLVRAAGGWPMHLDAIVALAEKIGTGVELTEEDLGGPLPDVVDRLFQDMNPAEQRLIQAACLMPYFDTGLLARAALTEGGDAERFVRQRWTLIQDNPGSRYPYRVHDDIRNILRRTGDLARGGWSSMDWRDSAYRALNEASRRFDSALENQHDHTALEALALALNVCAEHQIFQDWLIDAVRRSPSLRSLSARIALAPTGQSDGPGPAADPEISALLDYLRASSMKLSEEKAAAMHDIEQTGTQIASSAALWRAYSMRSLGRWDEAIAQFDHILKTHSDRTPL